MSTLDLAQSARVREQATWFEIDQSALKHNLSVVKQLVLPSAAILVMVKANAYGHGLREVAQSLQGEVAYFGVSTAEEALTLRGFDIDISILVFGIPFREGIEAAIQSEVSLAVSSVEQAREISQCAERLNKSAIVHIKVDTGMGRLGFPLRSAISAIEEVTRLPALHVEGLFTHFPQGEVEDDPFTQNQIRSFYHILEKASEKGIHFAYRHAANTIGIVNFREAHFNLVRPGILIYGLIPDESLSRKLPVKPVLAWRARIVLLKQLMAGESVGYHRSFVADRETLIGIVPVGYSHGYPFSLSNKSSVLHRGKRYPVAGRVSMDYLAVNFGLGFDGQVGDMVTLLGRDGNEVISGETLAKLGGTIPYEIMSRLGPSISRVLV